MTFYKILGLPSINYISIPWSDLALQARFVYLIPPPTYVSFVSYAKIDFFLYSLFQNHFPIDIVIAEKDHSINMSCTCSLLPQQNIKIYIALKFTDGSN